MNADSPHPGSGLGQSWPVASNRAQEIYEQLLALADQIGAAFAEANQKIAGACVEASHGLALGVGNWQDNVGDGPPWSRGFTTDLSKSLEGAEDLAGQLTERLAELGTSIGLAYLDAHERAALAAADYHQHLGAVSHVSLLETTTAAGAELMRKIVKAGAGAARDMID